jgi:hypothetical protein
MLLLPFILYLRKPEVKMKIYVLYTMIALGAALIFRYVDEKLIISWMPWGTHWLWHVSTAVAAWFLGEFIIRNDQIETDPK